MKNNDENILEYNGSKPSILLKTGEKFVIKLLPPDSCFVYAQLYDDLTSNKLPNKAYSLHGIEKNTTFTGTTDSEGIFIQESVPDDHYEVTCDGCTEIVEVYYMEEKTDIEGNPWILRMRGLHST